MALEATIDVNAQHELEERAATQTAVVELSVVMPCLNEADTLGTCIEKAQRALREHGIEVTALHNHMLDDEPRLFFMHFWANDDAKKLAEGLKAALALVNVAKS